MPLRRLRATYKVWLQLRHCRRHDGHMVLQAPEQISGEGFRCAAIIEYAEALVFFDAFLLFISGGSGNISRD